MSGKGEADEQSPLDYSDLYTIKFTEDIHVYIKFEIFQVNVPIIILGTVGFSAYREGRQKHVPGYGKDCGSN